MPTGVARRCSQLRGARAPDASRGSPRGRRASPAVELQRDALRRDVLDRARHGSRRPSPANARSSTAARISVAEAAALKALAEPGARAHRRGRGEVSRLDAALPASSPSAQTPSTSATRRDATPRAAPRGRRRTTRRSPARRPRRSTRHGTASSPAGESRPPRRGRAGRARRRREAAARAAATQPQSAKSGASPAGVHQTGSVAPSSSSSARFTCRPPA